MTWNKKILAWFDKQGRKDFPWQKNPTPYRVWVSEIMLQQTQVNTVIPYYERFMKQYPNVESLALAKLDSVLHLWTGLGYYARARNLHLAAKIICEHYQGKFPTQYENCVALPGIGPSTAGAILALSQEQRLPILDGNVKRVLTRYFAVHGLTAKPDVEAKLWTLARSLLPKTRLRDYTQALMDLGATVCTRTSPKCELCPIQKDCLARLNNQISILPTPKKMNKKPIRNCELFIFFHPKKQAVLLEKRPEEGIWGGLWSFPEMKKQINATNNIKSWALKELGIKISSVNLFQKFPHIFTHFQLNIEAYLCPLLQTHSKLDPKKYLWQPLSKKPSVGTSRPIQHLLKELQCPELCSA